jgi:hypothetical protein
MPVMSHPHRARPIIAPVAAYVVALQALLLPLSVALCGAPFFSLCSAGTSVASAQSPAGHQDDCPCAGGCGMQCCVLTLARPPQIATIIGLTQIGSLLAPAALEPVIRPAAQSPQVARAPPVA